MYDLIGDLHGHAEPLKTLLAKLGYECVAGVYRHPDRQVIFLGDFIDRGPAVGEVLQIVRSMVEAGAARAVLGNHEWNLLLYTTEDPASPGMYLRPHSQKNQKQVRATVEQLSPDELQAALDWFRTLPFWLELDGLRVIHACWDEFSLKVLRELLPLYDGKASRLTDGFLIAAGSPGRPGFEAVEILLKGKEAPLPDGMAFLDKDSHPRTVTRVRWYASPVGQTYRTYAMTDSLELEEPLTAAVVAEATPYPADARPVFIGHYSLGLPKPELLAPNVACLDFNITHRGLLCAYRWSGEQTLNPAHFCWVQQ